MSDIVIKSTPKAEMKVSIKVDGGSLPNGGAPGDVLTKTESGAEWQKPTGGGEGTVKTVNGIGPDENGNVELDISVDDSEVLDMMVELDSFPAVMDADGKLLTDFDGSILLM